MRALHCYVAAAIVLFGSRWTSAQTSNVGAPGDTATSGLALKGTTLVSERGLTPALELQILGNRIVLVNLPPASPVQVRDLQTGRLLKDLGTWGPREQDFIGLWHLDPVPNENQCWVWDLTRHRLALLDLSDTALAGRTPFRKWLIVRSDAPLTAPTWAADTLFSPGFFFMGRLASFSEDGRFARFVGTAPTRKGEEDEPVLATQQAYHSIMRPNADRTLFAIATRYAGHLQIMRRDGSIAHEGQTPMTFEPSYHVLLRQGEARVERDPSSLHGYTDLAVTRQFIFALFSGKREDAVGMYPDGHTIQVFDWSGALLAVYRLPSDANAIAVDEQTHKLYAMHTPPNVSIGVYTLPWEMLGRAARARASR